MDRLPAELVALVVGFLVPSAAAVVRLGAQSKRMFQVCNDANLWRRLLLAMNYPPVPDSLCPVLSCKHVALLAAKFLCDGCRKRSKVVNWFSLEKLCRSCSNVVPLQRHPATLLPEFEDYAKSLFKAGADAAFKSANILAAHKAGKRVALLQRFALLLPELADGNLLSLCPSFKRISSSKPYTVTDRTFGNARLVLEPELLRARIKEKALALFIGICGAVFVDGAAMWSPIKERLSLYDQYCTALESDFSLACQNEFFRDMKWNDSFPTPINLEPALNELQRKLSAPLCQFLQCKHDIISTYPKLNSMMNLFQAQWVSSIRDLFTQTLDPAVTTSSTTELFETHFREFVVQYRLHKLFPTCRAHWISPHPYMNTTQRQLCTNQNGVIAYYLKYPKYFDFKCDKWYTSYSSIETSAHLWAASIAKTTC